MVRFSRRCGWNRIPRGDNAPWPNPAGNTAVRNHGEFQGLPSKKRGENLGTRPAIILPKEKRLLRQRAGCAALQSEPTSRIAVAVWRSLGRFSKHLRQVMLTARFADGGRTARPNTPDRGASSEGLSTKRDLGTDHRPVHPGRHRSALDQRVSIDPEQGRNGPVMGHVPVLPARPWGQLLAGIRGMRRVRVKKGQLGDDQTRLTAVWAHARLLVLPREDNAPEMSARRSRPCLHHACRGGARESLRRRVLDRQDVRRAARPPHMGPQITRGDSAGIGSAHRDERCRSSSRNRAIPTSGARS